MALKTDYRDDILDLTQNTQRKYRMINNDDDTVSFEDVTDYLQVGDSFGSADVNAITKKLSEFEYTTVNELLSITERPTASTARTINISGYKKIVVSFNFGYVLDEIIDVDTLQVVDRHFSLGHYHSANYYAFFNGSLTKAGTFSISTNQISGWTFNYIKVMGIR